MSGPAYDDIGRTYDATRRADPGIVRGLVDRLRRAPGRRLLDLGCGTGNYTLAFREAGFEVEGLDLSAEMLAKARDKAPDLRWHHGDARALPFESERFDAVSCVLATHHIDPLAQALREIARVLRPGGVFATFTSTPEQIRGFWLAHYLPGPVELTARSMQGYEPLRDMLERAGLSQVEREAYVVGPGLQDFFLHCGKHRPELYLDPVVRAGISSFALYRDEAALREGLARLEADVASGQVREAMARQDDTRGDFLFVGATRAP